MKLLKYGSLVPTGPILKKYLIIIWKKRESNSSKN